MSFYNGNEFYDVTIPYKYKQKIEETLARYLGAT